MKGELLLGRMKYDIISFSYIKWSFITGKPSIDMHKVSIDFALQSFQAFVRVEKVSVISKHVKIKKIRTICNVIYIDKKQERA